jgi:hypothetical protein
MEVGSQGAGQIAARPLKLDTPAEVEQLLDAVLPEAD